LSARLVSGGADREWGRKRKKRKKEEETTTRLQENTPPRATRQPDFESKIQVLQILATQFS